MSIRGERLHAWLNGLRQPSDASLAREVFDKAQTLFVQNGVGTSEGREELIISIANNIFETIVGVDQSFTRTQVQDLVRALFNYDGLFLLPEIDWTERRSISEFWALREQFTIQLDHAKDFDAIIETLSDMLSDIFYLAAKASPKLVEDESRTGSIRVKTERLDLASNLPLLLEDMLSRFYADDVIAKNLFVKTASRLDRNLLIASGGNPEDPASFKRQQKLPTKSEINDRCELVSRYLGGTPLTRLFDGEVDFTIPQATRFEHQHIIAGTGHGKTQTLQYLIANDLEAVAEGKASVIVIDSQGDLINTISNLKRFAPGHPLHDGIVIIDPTDVEYPVSLNLFDVGIDRLNAYPMLERERLTNSILELYDFVLGSLLDAGMTQKQNVIFRYVTRLMLHIPDATIHTLRELMEPNGAVKFAGSIAKLTGTAKHFFETEFNSKEFEQTKRQVLRRLWGILENQTFERMFSHPRSKIDLFSEMNAGKIILINTAKDLLKENGTEIFGRFFIALIAQAAQERATLPENKRLPTFVYVDEAADYFDRNIGVILSQARKYNVGMILAHQYLGQLDPKLQDAFSANTSIKFAGGVSNKDARALAPMLGCDHSIIENQPKGSFAASVRGLAQGAASLKFPFGLVEKMECMSTEERHTLKDKTRKRYAVHYTELLGGGEDGEGAHGKKGTEFGSSGNLDVETEVNEQGAQANKPSQKLDPDKPDTNAKPDW